MRSLGNCKPIKPRKESRYAKFWMSPFSMSPEADQPSIPLQEVLFEPSTYTCDSRHHNLIAFQLEVGLLRRVLQAAGANDADSLEVSSLLCCTRLQSSRHSQYMLLNSVFDEYCQWYTTFECCCHAQVKLAMRAVPTGTNTPPVSKPFLTFTCRGLNLNMVQDLPISKPHLPAGYSACANNTQHFFEQIVALDPC